MATERDTVIAALVARRARATAGAEQFASEIDRVDGTPAAAVSQWRLAGVAAFVNKLDGMIGRRTTATRCRNRNRGRRH